MAKLNIVAVSFAGLIVGLVIGSAMGCSVVNPTIESPPEHFREDGTQCGVCPELFYNDISVSCDQVETDNFFEAFECICNGACDTVCDGMCFENEEALTFDDPCFRCINTPRILGGCADVWATCNGT